MFGKDKKPKNLSTQLVQMAEAENFKVFIGELSEGIAAMAGSGDRFFDTHGAGKVLLVDSKLEQLDRRIAMATILKNYYASYQDSTEDFYLEVRADQLSAEQVLDILIDEKSFAKAFKANVKKQGYNQGVLTTATQFALKPSLVSKYVRNK